MVVGGRIEVREAWSVTGRVRVMSELCGCFGECWRFLGGEIEGPLLAGLDVSGRFGTSVCVLLAIFRICV